MADLRMPRLNEVILAGRLGKDPEVRALPSGDNVANFSIASTEHYKDKSGERRENTTWIDVVAFRGTADYVGQYLRKGAAVIVQGQLQEEKWEDRNTGQQRGKHSIKAQRVEQLEWSDDAGGAARQSKPEPMGEYTADGDELPF